MEKNKKVQKNLWLAPWIAELFEREAESVGSDSLTAATMILMFAKANPEEKVRWVQAVHERELREAYGLADKVRAK